MGLLHYDFSGYFQRSVASYDYNCFYDHPHSPLHSLRRLTSLPSRVHSVLFTSHSTSQTRHYVVPRQLRLPVAFMPPPLPLFIRPFPRRYSVCLFPSLCSPSSYSFTDILRRYTLIGLFTVEMLLRLDRTFGAL